MFTSICDARLPEDGLAPEWVHLLPMGKMLARDGRKFELADPSAVIAAFEERAIDLPIDYEHQLDRPEATLKGPVPAAGWIKALRVDGRGLWGKVEWTATARAMIQRKEYRFLSPSFLHSKDGQVLRIKGAGLVHTPALHLKALASEETKMAPEDTPVQPLDLASFIQRLATILGLAPDATQDDVFAALGARPATAKEETVDPLKFVPVEVVAELLADRNSKVAMLNEKAAEALVQEAYENGQLTPAMRGWATSIARESPESFREFLSSAPNAYRNLLQPILPNRPPDRRLRGDDSDEAAAICAQLGLKPGTLNS